jgi:hypothetical protein
MNPPVYAQIHGISSAIVARTASAGGFGHAKRDAVIWGWGGAFASATLLRKDRRSPSEVARVHKPGRFSPSSPGRAFLCPRHVRGTGTLTSSPTVLGPGAVYTCFMRTFSLLFAAIALVMLTIFVIYLVRGPADPVIAGGIFVSFLACLVPALLLLKPYEPPEALRRRREEARRKREARRRSKDDHGRGSGS